MILITALNPHILMLELSETLRKQQGTIRVKDTIEGEYVNVGLAETPIEHSINMSNMNLKS